MVFLDLDDLLNSLRELIVLLPVVVLIFGPMLVRLLRRRQGAGAGRRAGAPAPERRQPGTVEGKPPGAEARPRRRIFPAVSPVGKGPAALRITREQVLSREAPQVPRPRPHVGEEAVSLEERLRETEQIGIARMKTSMETRGGIVSAAAAAPEPEPAGGRRRLEALSPLKKAVLWAEILGKPKGW